MTGRIAAYFSMNGVGGYLNRLKHRLRPDYDVFYPFNDLKSESTGKSTIDSLTKTIIDEMDNKRMPITRIDAQLLAMYNNR